MKEENYVSIVMSEYNSDIEQLYLSIESILNQTYKYFELIIVDDCGKNNVSEIVKKFKDDRIRVLKNEKNMGLARSLNRGIMNSKYDYIIRMDTDDIALSDRVKKQVEFANMHPEYSIIGGKYILFDEKKEYGISNNFTGEINKGIFLYGTPFAHPTLLIRKKDLIESGMYPNYRRGQDFAMEMQMYVKGFKGYNMEDILIKYRQDDNSFKKKNCRSRFLEYKIRKKYYKLLNLPLIRIYYQIRPLLICLIPKFILKNREAKKRKA